MPKTKWVNMRKELAVTRAFFLILLLAEESPVVKGQFQQQTNQNQFIGQQNPNVQQQGGQAAGFNTSPFGGFNPFSGSNVNQWSSGLSGGQQQQQIGQWGQSSSPGNLNSLQPLFANGQQFSGNVDMSNKDRRAEEGWTHLYPYGEIASDIDMHLRPGRDLQIDLDFLLPYYGFRHNYTFIFMEGFVAFSYPHYIQPPYTFPVKGWPEKPDPSVIAPFMMESNVMHVGDDHRLSHVWYRIIQRSLKMEHTTMMGSTNFALTPNNQQPLQYQVQQFSKVGRVIDPYMLDTITRDIQQGMVGARGFSAYFALVVTWERMAYGGAPKITDLSAYDTEKKNLNTFQLVIATDEIRTYVMFNYANINWTSSTQAGAFSGRGGKQSAMVGFNGGNGTGWQDLAWSADGNSYKLFHYGSTQTAGRWLARVDEEIEYGGCSNATTGVLRTDKQQATMLGGFSINVTAACFRREDVVKLQIDEETVNCEQLDMVVARCVVDVNRSFKTGLVAIALSVDGGKTYPWRNSFYLLMPSMARRQIELINDPRNNKNRWTNIEAQTLNLTWPSANISSNPNTQVDIMLYGYWEDMHSAQLMPIGSIARNQPNSGRYAFTPRTLARTDLMPEAWRRYVGGVVQVRLANNWQADTGDGLYWSELVPFGWYFWDIWRGEFGHDWALGMCIQWFEHDGHMQNFYRQLETDHSCPCTLQQAVADVGRFVAMHDCDYYGNHECRYTKGAKHCVVSTEATLAGAGQVCCYDFQGWLMFSHDYEYDSEQLKGYSPGVPYRAHPWGSQQYKRPPYIPSLSNFHNDLMPYDVCCKWAGHCEFYFWRRMTSGCQNYRPPALGFVYGNGHFITFDNTKYTFNGKGYYTLLHRERATNVQIRMETPTKNVWNVTVVTGLAAQDGDSDIVEVYARKDFRQWRYKTDVYINRHRVYFDTAWQKLQKFKGVTIRSLPNNMNMSELEIMFSTGMGLMVSESRGSLNVIVSVPPGYNETRLETNRFYATPLPTGVGRCSSYVRTIGLLGPWNNDPLDDLITPDCHMTSATSHPRNIYLDFGEKWRIATGSHFTLLFDPNRKALYDPLVFVDNRFKPVFDEWTTYAINQKHSLAVRRGHVMVACQNSKTCEFDYVTTGKSEFGIDTLNAERQFENRKYAGQKLLISCGPLQKNDRVLKTPAFGNTYLDGVKVLFSCGPDYFLHGDQERVCVNGTWNEGWWAWCRWRDEEYALKIFTAFIVTVILVALIVSVFCWCNGLRKKQISGRARESNATRRFAQMPRIGGDQQNRKPTHQSIVPVFEGQTQKVALNGSSPTNNGHHSSSNGSTPPKQQQLRFAETSA